MPTRTRLPNGLTVLHEHQPQGRVVAVQLWFAVGSADERADEVGLAHLHEHLLFKGTAGRGPGEIARAIEAHGGEINAWTSFDQTVYHVVMARQHAAVGFDVLADAARRSVFDEGELAREQEVVCEEIKRSLDQPARRASKALFAQAYQRHPYGRPVIGDEASVRSHTRARMLRFFHQHYRPEHATLVVVGSLPADEALALSAQHFGGDWAREPAEPLAPRPQEPERRGQQVLLLRDDVTEAHLGLTFPGPALAHPDTPALDVLAMILGQGDASRLSLEVRRKRSLAKEAHAYAWTPKEPGLIAASLVCAPEQAAAALAETLTQLRTLREEPVSAEELATVQALFEAETVYGRETVQGLARKFGFYEVVAGGVEREAAYLAAVAQVTPERLLEVAQRWLRLEQGALSGLVPQAGPQVEAELEAVLSRATAGAAPKAAPRKAVPVPKPAPPAPRSSTDFVDVTLPSGARLLVQEDRTIPLVAYRATFLGGLLTETEADNGRSALLARTWTRGAGALDAEEVSHLVDELAGSLGASAGRSTMSVRGDFLAKHQERALELFCDVLLQPRFDEGEVRRERLLLIQDAKARRDRPAALALELFQRTLFTAHPYRLVAGGQPSSLEALEPAQLVSHHRAFLHPGALTLAIAGDVDAKQVVRQLEQRLGRGASARPPLPRAPEPPPTARREARLSVAKAQSHLILGFPGVAVTSPERRAVELLTTVLSGQSGRLFLTLRDQQSLAYSVSASSVEGLDPGWLCASMGTSPEKVPQALDGLRAALQRLVDEPVPTDELRRAQALLSGGYEIGLQRLGARAGVMALDAALGLPPLSYQQYAAELAGVTPAQLQATARALIRFEREVLVVVGPDAP